MAKNSNDLYDDGPASGGAGSEKGLSFDMSADHEQPVQDAIAVDPEQQPQQPKKATVRKAGSTSSKRITGAYGGASDPMRDKVVLNELKQPLPHEKDIEFPYEATVITKHDPLRLRASSSLSAKVIGHMSRGRVVNVTGPSMNHFRPVSYKDGDKPEQKGWAFTAYLSPAWHTLPEVVVVAQRKKVGAAATQPTKKEEHVEVPVASSEEKLPEPHEVAHAEVEAARIDPVTIKPATVTGPQIPTTDASIAIRVTDEMVKINGPTTSTATGLHYKDRYKQELETAGRGSEWKSTWSMGHTQSALWDQPYELNEPMTWLLREGASASEALRQWLAGLTIVDCTSAMVAIELDAVRAAVGDRVFDRCFGSVGAPGLVQQLKISQRIADTPLYALMRFTDAAHAADEPGALGKRPVQAGEWYYFSNVPDYLLKHPGGAWRGENALCLGVQNGKQMWSGLGATYDEEGMMRALVEAYNRPRDEADFAWFNRHYIGPSRWPEEYKTGFAATHPNERPVCNDGAKDTLKLEDVLAAQAAPSTDGSKRKRSGIQLSSGMALSTLKLIELSLSYGDPQDVESGPDGPVRALRQKDEPQLA